MPTIWLGQAGAAGLSTMWMTFTIMGSAPHTSLPFSGLIRQAAVNLTSINGAASVTAYLSHDAAGTKPVTPSAPSGATQAISLAEPGGTAGGVVLYVETDYWKEDGLYLRVKLDAGTATGEPRVYVETT